MNHEDFLLKISAIDAEKAALRVREQEINGEWMALCPHAPGSKVRVRYSDGVWSDRFVETLAYITDIRPSISKDRPYKYSLCKVKKDGTPHAHYIHTYGGEVEILEVLSEPSK